jgi:hypothetical protein
MEDKGFIQHINWQPNHSKEVEFELFIALFMRQQVELIVLFWEVMEILMWELLLTETFYN